MFASDYAIFLEALTRILARSQEDPDLRTVMRHLAQMVIESTDGPKAIPSGGGGPHPPQGPASPRRNRLRAIGALNDHLRQMPHHSPEVGILLTAGQN
ncbi:MAG: hypothetical protein ACK5F7_14400, partial [Planctomycetaceae bacterium]